MPHPTFKRRIETCPVVLPVVSWQLVHAPGCLRAARPGSQVTRRAALQGNLRPPREAVHIPGWDLALTEAARKQASPSLSRVRLGGQKQKEPRNSGQECVCCLIFQ